MAIGILRQVLIVKAELNLAWPMAVPYLQSEAESK
jgi:hypothetical protein